MFSNMYRCYYNPNKITRFEIIIIVVMLKLYNAFKCIVTNTRINVYKTINCKTYFYLHVPKIRSINIFY